MNARVATALTAAGALSMTMFAATKALASAPAQPDSQLAMTITDRTLAYGQSLVVTAIAEGRKCARMVDRHLMGEPEFELEPEDQATITDAHFLELEAQTAGTVTVSDEFFSGPGEPDAD